MFCVIALMRVVVHIWFLFVPADLHIVLSFIPSTAARFITDLSSQLSAISRSMHNGQGCKHLEMTLWAPAGSSCPVPKPNLPIASVELQTHIQTHAATGGNDTL